MNVLFLATRNRHKVEELRAMLGTGWELKSLADLSSAPELPETAGSFEGNAAQKAGTLARWLAGQGFSGWVLADDSGLEVDALHGAPGVNSARFAAMDSGKTGNSADAENNAKLMRLLETVPSAERTARFRCVLALTPIMDAQTHHSPVCLADEMEVATELFSGACEGRIESSLKGAKGFGYDPMFYPQGYQQSFAELGKEVKNRISHRSQAVARLKKRLDELSRSERKA